MRELEYPYKREYLLTRKKQIKRLLLDERSNFLNIKIAILAGSTVNDIKDLMELFLLNYGIKPEFYLSEYNKYYEDAVFENEMLKSFAPDIVYVCTSFRNVNYDFDLSTDENVIEDKLKYEIDKYHSIWQSIKEKYNAVIIQNNFEYPNYRLLGNKDITNVHGFSNFLMRLNNAFYDYAKSSENFYICDLNYISANFGLSKWHSEKYFALYKMPCVPMGMVDIAYNTANIIKSLYGKNKKTLALDLDNTLWGGIISEDGIDNIKVGAETAEGETFLGFQKYIKKLKSLGIILNVVSKNDEELAVLGLEKSDGVLKKDDFVMIKANFEPKSDNINELSKELALGTDSFAFIDDNPVERDIVEKNVIGVGIAHIENPEGYIEVVDKSGFFEITNISEEDLSKTKQYQANIARETLKTSFTDYKEYLLSLDMQAEIKSFTSKYYDRISQLSNKSNQFNVTTKRYTATEIEKVAEDDNYISLYGKLIDKFGDNGIVSIFIGKINGDTLNIELFLMSCRVLKREMEFAMMDEIVGVCKEKGIKKITGEYLKTEKNMMVKDLYKSFGFAKVSEDENGNSKWILSDISKYKKLCNVININKGV